MNEPLHPPLTPFEPANRGGTRQPPRPSIVGTARRALALSLGSLVVMLPWPLVGILLLNSQFDRATEAFLFLGGITLFPLMILALAGNPSEEVLIGVVTAVWLVAAFVPTLVLRARLVSRWRIGLLLGAQALFAFAQAAMGALLIIGKSV